MTASTSEDTTTQRFQQQWLDDEIATKYARAEKATKPFAAIMAQKAGASGFTGEERILDIATGTGAVVAELHDAVGKEKWDGLKIVAGDIGDSMLTFVKKRAEKEGWKGVDARKIDGVNVGTDETFSHIFINFGIFVLPPDSLEKAAKLLRPNGFVAVSTWAYFPWYPLLERSHARMSNPPPLPSYDTIKDRIYQGKSWDADYVRKELEKAGFNQADIVQEKKTVNCGTPAQFTETMQLPLMLVVGGWPEADRQKLQEEISEKMMAIAAEGSGSDGTFDLDFEGIVGVGWKA